MTKSNVTPLFQGMFTQDPYGPVFSGVDVSDPDNWGPDGRPHSEVWELMTAYSAATGFRLPPRCAEAANAVEEVYGPILAAMSRQRNRPLTIAAEELYSALTEVMSGLGHQEPSSVAEDSNARLIEVEEEYGFREWVGFLPDDMTVESVIEWWKELPSVMDMFFNPSDGFPVKLYELETTYHGDEYTLSCVDGSGKKHTLDPKNVVLYAHVHEDDDSCLLIPGGEKYFHAGYEEK